MAQMHRVVSEYKLPDNAQSNIRVYVRARPLEDGAETSDFLSIGSEDLRQVSIKDPDTSNQKYSEVKFEFDRVFWTDIGQEEIFNSMCKPQVDHVLEGFNTCCFAYGQTGSGKTYSMFGCDDEIRGIIPRSAECLFQSLAKKSGTTETAVVCSFLEIYNDQVRDLGKAYLVSIGAETSTSAAIFNKTSDIFESLAGKRGNPYFAPAFYNSSPTKLGSSTETASRGLGYKEVQDEYRTMNMEIHEDGEGNVFVRNLSMVPVTTIEEVMSMVDSGLKVRATHETKMNASSSRSHTVFTLSVLQRDKITGSSITGMLNLVDLAGSERLKKSESTGIRLKEALHINTSLSALGKVIMSLDPSAESTHIPYRDAKLTRILQNSLGGNSYTIVLAAIHPSVSYYEECLSTLQFANRCRNVRNNPRVNYVDDPGDKDVRIRRMQEELVLLRTKVSQFEKGGGGSRGVGGGGGGNMSAEKLMNVLKRLGVTALLSADGALMVNGERHGLEELGLGGDSDESASGDEGMTPGSKRGSMTSKDTLKKMCLDLQEANKIHSTKSKDRKILMQEQGKQIQELSKQVTKLQSTMKRTDHDTHVQKEAFDVSIAEGKRLASEASRHEMDKLILRHETMMKKQIDLYHNAPNVFKSYTSMVRQKSQEKGDYEEPLRKEFAIQIATIEAAHMTESTSLKKQYDYFLGDKDKLLSEFADKFSIYKNKKTEQLRMCEQEIIKLFEYAEQIDVILDNIETGLYPVEQKQGKFGKTSAIPNTTTRRVSVPNAAGILSADNTDAFNNSHHQSRRSIGAESVKGRVMLPRGLRPSNPMKQGGSNEMKLSKKIIDKHMQRKEKFEISQRYLERKTSNFARTILTSNIAKQTESERIDPYVEQHLRDLLGPVGLTADLNGPRVKADKKSFRPSSAPSIPKSLSVAATSNRFHGQEEGKESALSQFNTTGNSTDPSEGGVGRTLHGARTYSISSVRDPAFGLSPGSRSTSPNITHRISEARITTWAADRKNVFDRKNKSNHNLGGSIASMGEINSNDEILALRAELIELKAQNKVDQQLITGISSNEMIQYIQKLEEENNELHDNVREVHAELRAIKVVNATLTHGQERISKNNY